MTAAHAATMNGVDGWKFEVAEIEGGASLAVHAPAKDADKLRGLGFLGVLTLGMHHQIHHLMIARVRYSSPNVAEAMARFPPLECWHAVRLIQAACPRPDRSFASRPR